MGAGAIMTTGVTLIATFGLAFMVGVNPLLPAAVAGALLFAVLLIGNPSLTVHALLIVTFTTMLQDIPVGIRIAGYFIWNYEFFVFGSLLYAIGLLRASPVTAKRLRNSVAVWAALLFGIPIAVGVSAGILREYSLKDIQLDARPVVDMMIVIFVVAVIVAVNDWRRYMNTITAILIFSAAVTVYASATRMPLGGRTEAAQLYAKAGGGVLSGGSDAIRYLTQTTPLALAVLAGCVTLLVLGRITAIQALPMLIPSLVITVLSFSRNSLLVVAGALIFALVVALLDGRLLRAVWRLVEITLIAGIVGFGLITIGGASGAGDWIDTQVTGYANRVIAGFSQQVEANDGSAQYRLQEDMYIKKSGADHPLLGGGFGYRYKPSIGEPGSFEADRGQLYAHNAYGWLYVKAGVVGVVTFLVLVVASVLPALGRRRSNPLLAAAAAAVVGLSVAMIVVPMLIDHGTSALLGLVIGACLGAGALGAPRSRALHHESSPPIAATQARDRQGGLADLRTSALPQMGAASGKAVTTSIRVSGETPAQIGGADRW
ncbi:MAG: hypothetical protein JWR34_5543 [Mycobacterium sp.]|nr:hypothetical protein [Mycobacterium sp.]